MEAQNKIKRTLSQPEGFEHIKRLLDANNNIKITKLADKLCEQCSFLNQRGLKQQAGWVKALRALERCGLIDLPVPPQKRCKRSPIHFDEPVPELRGVVPSEVGEIIDLELILVDKEEHMRIWNELMIQDHPRSAGLQVGQIILYLIESEHGWLGGFGFGASALYLQDRVG